VRDARSRARAVCVAAASLAHPAVYKRTRIRAPRRAARVAR
jgi:hypothetical protein